MSRYGVRGVALNLIRSYLRDRPQIVAYNDASSDEAVINVGVGQGTCLGPEIYSIYTNDIGLYLSDHESSQMMFADDTTLVLTGSDLHLLEERANNLLLKVQRWCSFNKLSLCAPKTKATLFTNRRIPEENLPNIRLNGVVIDFVSSHTYL